ncbi:MAG: HEAT repeat domain-containing protein [Elusimicrobia bacterium]|nr:HEAT repeat domain-containing protein [Elusimicrobiota bacterium]
MKFALAGIIFVIAGYFAFQQFKPKPPPPPPPPPPPILQEPAPLIDEAEAAKIVKSTTDQDPGVRWEAVVLLDKMKSPKAYPIMFEMLHKDSETSIRLRVIELLQTRHTPEVTQNVVGALKDMEPDVRVSALRALDNIGDYSTAPAIMETLKDQEETVRVQALRTLNDLQDRRAAEIRAAQQRAAEEAAAAAAAAKKR